MPDQVELRVAVDVSGADKLDQLAHAVDNLEKTLARMEPAVKHTHEEVHHLGEEADEQKEKIKQFGEALERWIETPGKTASQAVRALLETLGPLGVGLAASVGVMSALGTAAYESAEKLGSLGTQINNTAIRMGLTTEEVQKFSYAAKLTGSDIGSLEGAMRIMTRALSDNAEEGKKAKDALAKMGIETHDIFGNAMKTSEVFLQMSDALNKMSSSNEQASFMMAVMGRRGLELLPVLLKLRENLESAGDIEIFSDKQRDEFEQMHQHVVKLEDDFGKLTHAIEAIAGKTFVITLDFVQAHSGTIGGLAGAFGESASLPGQIAGAGGSLIGQYYSDQFSNLAGAAGSLFSSSAPGRFLSGVGAAVRSPFQFDRRGPDTPLNATGINGALYTPAPETEAGKAFLNSVSPNQAYAPSVAAGASLFQRAERERTSQGKEGLEADVELAKKASKEAWDAFQASKGDILPVSQALYETWEKTNAAQLKAVASLKAYTDGLEAVKSHQDFILQLTNRDANPVEKLFNELDKRQEKLPGRTPAQAAAETIATSDAAQEELRKLRDKFIDETEAQDKINLKEGFAEDRRLESHPFGGFAQPNEQGESQEQQFKRNIETQVRGVLGRAAGIPEGVDPKQYLEFTRSLDSIREGSEREGLQRESSRAQRTAELNVPLGSGSAGQVGGINSAYTIRLDLATKIRDIETDRAAKETDATKRIVDLEKAKADFIKESEDAQLERQMKLLELAQKQQEEARNLSGGLFDAITSKNPGQATHDFFMGQVKDVGRSVFQNLTQSAALPFAGTLDQLKSVGAKTPTITAIDLTTKAVYDVRDTIAYVASGGAAGSAPPGWTMPAGGPSSGGLGSIPGLGTFASDVNGITGQGSLTGAVGSNPLTRILRLFTGGGGGGGAAGGGGGTFGGGGINTDDPGAPGGGTVSASSITTALKGLNTIGASFGAGASSVALGGGLPTLLHGSNVGLPGVNGNPGTDLGAGAAGIATQVGAGIGLAGAAYAGVSSAIHDFKKGGPQGIIGGIGAVAGTASAFDPEPISHAILAGVALTATVVAGLFGDPRANRQSSINHELQNNAYNSTGYIDQRGNFVPGAQPRSISYFGASGGESYDTNFQGGIRGGSYASTTRNTYDPSSAANQLRNGYLSPPAGTPNDQAIGFGDQPGGGPRQSPTTSNGQITQPPLVIHIQTMDAKSFLDNASLISSAVRKGIQMGHPVVQEIQQVARTR